MLCLSPHERRILSETSFISADEQIGSGSFRDLRKQSQFYKYDVTVTITTYFASGGCGNSSLSQGQTETDTVGSTVSTVSVISHGHTAQAPTFSETSLGPSLKNYKKNPF